VRDELVLVQHAPENERQRDDADLRHVRRADRSAAAPAPTAARSAAPASSAHARSAAARARRRARTRPPRCARLA
jgi:hypothetical protein